MVKLPGENLIFLISQPRAGSTLLQLMLSGSPDIATTSEPWISLHPFFALRELGINSVYNSQLAKTALLTFLKESGMNTSSYKNLIASFLTSLYDKAINHQGKKYFLDKTPRYYHIIDDLFESFPKAKFIILFRNPLAVLNSILRTWVKSDLSFLCYYIEDLIVAPKNLTHCIQNNLNNLFKVNYESLVVEPEITLMDLSRFLGIEYSKNMINYGWRLNSEWRLGDQVGIFNSTRPITDSINKWKDGFQTPQTVQFAFSYLDALGPTLIKGMGYDYDDIKSSISSHANHPPDNLVSWTTIMNIMESFSNTGDIRRVVLSTLSNEVSFKGVQSYQNFNSNYAINKIISKIIYPKINELTNEIIALTEEVSKYKGQRDAMRNTLSWRMTAPARNCSIINKIISYLKSI